MNDKEIEILIAAAHDVFPTCGTDAETRAMRWLAAKVIDACFDKVAALQAEYIKHDTTTGIENIRDAFSLSLASIRGIK